jgi:hydrogenase maturation protein HypF
MRAAVDALSQVRGRIRVRGQVQGVGFRPFVYRLARELSLTGWVRNDGQGVVIEVQGAGPGVAQMLKRLQTEAPSLARVDRVEYQSRSLVQAAADFVIEESRDGPAETAITPDTAVCPDCLTELFERRDRRYRYPFINCTQCGPRYTLTLRLPYDRPYTSMARFTQCPACQSEYDDPENRRFHAQPNACPVCGPRLELLDTAGRPATGGDPISETLARLLRGEIVAIKGLGGFHLACDARDGEAVARLRARKQREEKPFAMMMAGAASLYRWVRHGDAEIAVVKSAERPIVLMYKRPGVDAALAGIAPGLGWLGMMLPYTPLHYLLFHEAAGRPGGLNWLEQPQELALVMTSANPGGEPLVTGNDEALARLAGIADAFLVHDRDIVVRCDDSVVRVAERGARGADHEKAHSARSAGPDPQPLQFIRRARGYTPRAIKLARSSPPVLALGGWFKNTICLTRGDEAFVSQHIGDLDNAPTCRAMEETVHHLMDVLQISPAIVAHDLHPDFHSTRFAADFARERGLPAVAVQHHHAHIAALAAEHHASGPLLGLALDGVGLGTDGEAWGGELLLIDGAQSTRLAHLRPLALPGGDRAAREPWRMAASALHALGRGEEIERRLAQPGAAMVKQMLERGVHAPMTSSAGRLFDAAAGIVGLRAIAAFEGQAPMLFEGLAEARGPVPALADGFRIADDASLDFLPLLGALADCSDLPYAASLFHATVAEGLAQWVLRAAADHGIQRVALGGGCFLNRVLSCAIRSRLVAEGVEVLEARQVPPNDGGLALGQAWVAMNSGSRIGI